MNETPHTQVKGNEMKKKLGLGGDLLTADEIFDESERIRRIERAAPELLEALKKAKSYIANNGLNWYGAKEANDAAREAIAKAEGKL